MHVHVHADVGVSDFSRPRCTNLTRWTAQSVCRTQRTSGGQFASVVCCIQLMAKTKLSAAIDKLSDDNT
jgi:hypothetical protein